MALNAVGRLPAEVNRALFVKNLSFNVKSEELYELFGRFGAIRQVRLGTSKDTKGTAYVVYEDVYDAKTACEKLSGYNFGGRYLTVLYHSPEKLINSQAELAERKDNLERLKKMHNID